VLRRSTFRNRLAAHCHAALDRPSRTDDSTLRVGSERRVVGTHKTFSVFAYD
jgi:hypothetical protein